MNILECGYQDKHTCVPSLSKTTRTGSDTPTQSFSRPGHDDSDEKDFLDSRKKHKQIII